jgi:PhnB protein
MMSVNVVTHLNFRGDARAALTFYQSVFGGDLAVVTYQDAGDVQETSEADQVMWGQVAADNGFRVMAYDVPSHLTWDQGENAFFVSLRGEAAEEITAYWEKLSDGATVLQPLGPAQWAPLYGMLKDRFGVTWVVDVVSEYNAS